MRDGAIAILGSMALAACGSDTLCCGFSILSDWTSDITIARDGSVVFANVSAVAEVPNGYLVEIGRPGPDGLSYASCTYGYMDRTGGYGTYAGGAYTGNLGVAALGTRRLLISNRHSCNFEALNAD